MTRAERVAVVLAGGFGTRLAHVVPDVCKPMAPVAGRPFLRFILDGLSESGFERVVVADGYKRESIESYFGGSYRGMEIIYSPEESPLLTGGAVKRALAHCESEWVYVFNGDTYLDVDYGSFEAARDGCSDGADAFIAVKMMRDFDRYGTVEVDESGTIRSFREKTCCEAGLINAGVYLLKASSLGCMPEKFSLESDFFEGVVSSGALVAVEMEGEFIDIGVPEDYSRAQIMLAPLVRHWKLAMFDRDGTLNVDTGHLHEPEKLEFVPSGIEELRRYCSDSDYKVVVVTNQAGIAKGMYGVAEMRKFHRFFVEQLHEVGCRVDAFYFCPHHPDFTGPCICRKPAPGMIEKAIFDFDASPDECVLYGDKQTDIDAARAAGVRGVLVKGGHSLGDNPCVSRPIRIGSASGGKKE